ncbi:hypothetical protein CKO15_06115 [Halorhodospira abdelmalekii]|uniref:PH domain-containing protein n=1 Tax=Halorhodospira abdelmalekii TaxID=421629 RepID=UPI00190442A4|nr:PH domain-containing protein [Halorhodospira abdelmalekii]MBK1734871.1 hypothetical protein [Halorhodospira abdelmalekii]
MILDHQQRPWSQEEALHIRELLYCHGGVSFDVVEHEGGYALRPHQSAAVPFETVRLRPAVRAHPGAIMQALLGAGAIGIAPRAPALSEDLPQALTQVANMDAAPLGLPLATVLVAAVGALLLLRGAVQLLVGLFYYRYELGPDRLEVREGIVHRHRRSIDYRHARIPTLEQGTVDLILGIGSVCVSSAGSGESGEVTLYGIKRPQAVLEEIQSRIDKCQ